MQSGAVFSLGKMLEGQRNVRDLGLFNSVKLKAIGLQEKRKEVDLVVTVEEKKPYFFELGAGYESQKGFYANSRAGDHNLFGKNKDGWIEAEVSEIGYRTEARIREPRLWGSRIVANAGLFAERKEEFNKDFGTRTYGASIGLGRTLWKHLTAGLDTRYERRDQYKLAGVVPSGAAAELEPRSIVVTTPALRYDTRDSFMRPTRGGLAQLAVDISSGLTNDLDDFLKYRADFRYFITPHSRLTFACIARAGYIDPYGAFGTVPEDQLFFLGGTADVRGFDENLLSFDAQGNALGGRSQLSGSLEARIDLGWNLELTLFYDVGRIGETLVDNDTTNVFRKSTGTGLRYITPIGPVGLLYGRKLDTVEGEGPDQFHLSIGYTF
jgi:outer membrane protein insertion porin family